MDSEPRGVFSMFALAVVMVLILMTMWCSFTIVPAGTVGVKDFFGNVNPTALSNGFNLKGPLVKIRKMSVQTQELKETAETPSKEGLSMGLEVSILFMLDPAKAPQVYRSVGMNYPAVIIDPQFRSAIREVTASYEAKALYSAERAKIQTEIEEYTKKLIGDKGIIVQQVLLRKITLPQVLSSAIQEKLKREQEAMQMEFTLAKETKEADRKRIEAQGISDFQRIVSLGISDKLIEWKAIEALERLATSQNTKVIVIPGSSKNGMPFIIDAKQ